MSSNCLRPVFSLPHPHPYPHPPHPSSQPGCFVAKDFFTMTRKDSKVLPPQKHLFFSISCKLTNSAWPASNYSDLSYLWNGSQRREENVSALWKFILRYLGDALRLGTGHLNSLKMPMYLLCTIEIFPETSSGKE
ncbi:solute carrier family 14 (urea transporter), member 2, isoform CRA_f [Rattus norvegicus]|uniref:Solute carrier family 14 (Urea transporter), member 2, isoform CRA_f n=1 Tax=Rattus norvegicus TaxID=10116 RepID=A6KMX9_RAT|nr:solute carrier family 14 (urea transporter), member 2, isoform CRA_f [Rattus norvegicus]